jgi:hypothetical protein
VLSRSALHSSACQVSRGCLLIVSRARLQSQTSHKRHRRIHPHACAFQLRGFLSTHSLHGPSAGDSATNIECGIPIVYQWIRSRLFVSATTRWHCMSWNYFQRSNRFPRRWSRRRLSSSGQRWHHSAHWSGANRHDQGAINCASYDRMVSRPRGWPHGSAKPEPSRA